jgi:hypothetical protein
MKNLGWEFNFGAFLVALSAFFYFIHFMIFRGGGGL